MARLLKNQKTFEEQLVISDTQFMALFPLYSLAKQAHENRDPNFDWSMSRDDYMNGKNGIPSAAGVKCVFALLTAGDLVEMSQDQQSFRISLVGVEAVRNYASTQKQ